MKKLHFLKWNRRGGRVLAGLFFCLTACGAFAADDGAAVSFSPLGTSRLSWVRPGQAPAVPAPAPAPVPAAANLDTAQDTLFLTELETSAPDETSAPENGESIRQVRLLETAAEAPVSEPVPIKLAMATDTAPKTGSAPSTNAYDVYTDECPDPTNMDSILDMSYKVTVTPGEMPQSCPLPEETYVRKLPTPIVFTWKASALCHKPLYFEDVQLERYGHGICPLLQPALSGARFWVTIPFVPYLMGVYPPTQCVYDLGYYRPGSCAPNMIQPCPISMRGALIEAGAIVGAAYAIP
ncbi:MAG: hypothetical protein K6E55_10155 [Thermoguttaceae bacterium]|nr:hypothetical protein [Thermoguttaceae bacterium]